ncbi:MAG: CoA transferase [Acidimicrobiaceae bacterium]|nr:CoA transferase [Acidimicrobiaceae bacterium]
MAAPLDDVKVIEVDSWMATPSAGAILADLGADVIKVEPLDGDPMRGYSRPAKLPPEIKDYDFQFDVDNRGKRSIAVDLGSPQGQQAVHQLIAGADVFMCNLLAHRQERFGLDSATVTAVNPRIVHATLTGYGTSGPEAWRPGYDVTAFFGRSGIYDAMREGPDGAVPMARPAQGDHTTGLALVGAVLAALRLAERTGEAQVVETSLYETAVWTQASDYAITAVDRAPLRQRARENMIVPTANRYPCGDGKWVVLNMPQESAWPLLCRIIERLDWLNDERFADIRGRFAHMPEIVAGIDEALAHRTRDEWGEIFDAEGIIWGPVLGLHEVVDDAQAEALGMFPTLDSPDIGPYRSVGIPMRFANAEVGPRRPSPKLGEHTRDVLAAAGMSEAEIDGLIADDAVREAPERRV